MQQFLQEAGWGIWLVLAFGLFTLVVAARYALAPHPGGLVLVVGGALATLCSGGLGTLTGLQASVSYVARVEAAQRWLFLVGLRESLNNLVAALVLVLLASLLATVGGCRQAARRTAGPAGAGAAGTAG